MDDIKAIDQQPMGVERIASEIRDSLGRGATVATRRRWAIELEALAGQPVGAVRHDTGITVTLDRLPYYRGVRLASGTKLYARPPASVDEVAALRGLLDEVRSHCTRDDDLPDDLLPRIDAALDRPLPQ